MPTTNALRSINHFIELRIFSRSSTPQVKSLLPLKNLAKDTVDGKVVKATNLNHARLGVQPRQPVHRGERRVERVFLLLGKVRSRSRNGLVGSFKLSYFLLGSSIIVSAHCVHFRLLLSLVQSLFFAKNIWKYVA